MDTLILSENNNQQHIEIAVDDIIQLQLDESPTTGYRWRIVNLDTHGIQVISEDFKINAHAGVGGAGKKVIKLKVLRKTAGSLRLENRRSWDQNLNKNFEIFYS
jgi:inhibitor of cysteine peptidase